MLHLRCSRSQLQALKCPLKHSFHKTFELSETTSFHSSILPTISFSVSSLVPDTSCCCLVAKPCPTLCDTMDCSPPVSSVHGISQARILEWVVISYSRGSSWPRGQTHISCIAGRFFPLCHLGSPSGTYWTCNEYYYVKDWTNLLVTRVAWQEP